MEENEILEEIEETEEASTELSSGEDTSDQEITDQEILDAVREVIYENRESNIEGDNLQLVEDPSSTPSPSPEVIDYTQLLTDIKNQQVQTNSSLTTLIEDQEKTIFDKELSEYNITETILIFLVVFCICTVFVGFIKKFTPKLWR